MSTIIKDRTLEQLAAISNKDLHWLLKNARRELVRRHREAEASYKARQEGFQGLKNFMAGVTWALACRASLRKSKGHTGFGKRPASGAPWMPWEILYAAREEVKEKHWSPLTQQSADAVLVRLNVQANRKPEPTGDYAVSFKIPFAKEYAQVNIDVSDGFPGRSLTW